MIFWRQNLIDNFSKTKEPKMLIRNPRCENTHYFSIRNVLEKSGHFPNRKSEKEACFLSPCRSENQAPFDVFPKMVKHFFLVHLERIFNRLYTDCRSMLKILLRKQFKMCHCHDNLAFSPEGRKRKKEKR